MEIKKKYFACKLKNHKLRMESQSGGAFTAIASYFIKNGGVVYGCGMSSDNQAIYKRIDNIDDLGDLKGSKYVQASMVGIFKLMKKDLDEGKKVLYSGTPCYVNSVICVFACHSRFDNLMTIDLICHGVPSPKVLKDYLELYKKKEDSHIAKFIFRDKLSGGWHQSREKIIFQNGKEIIADDYTELFYTNLILRPSCGNCIFSSMNRCADFTIGDFWGIQKVYPELDDNTGVSLLFANNEKALALLSEIEKVLEIIEVTSTQACQQRNLTKTTSIPKASKWFWNDYKKKGINYCLKKWSPKAGTKFRIRRKILKLFNKWE